MRRNQVRASGRARIPLFRSTERPLPTLLGFAGMLAIATLSGCYSEEKFAEDLATTSCDSLTACEQEVIDHHMGMGMGESDAQATFDEVSDLYCAAAGAAAEDAEADDSCTFDSGAAKDCIDAVEAMTCDDWVNGTFPAVCATTCG